jgi:hypothetical protein
MRTARGIGLLTAAALVGAGCAGAGGSAVGMSAGASAGAQAVGTPAEVSPAASTLGQTAPALTQQVDAGPLVLEVPADWHVRPSFPNPSGNFAYVFLSPADLPNNCLESASGGVCHAWPAAPRDPGWIEVAVRLHGNPGSQPPAGGDPITVAGLPARRSSSPADQPCLAIGGSRSIVVALEAVPDATGWLSIDACIAGEGTAAVDTFDTIVASATIGTSAATAPAATAPAATAPAATAPAATASADPAR